MRNNKRNKLGMVVFIALILIIGLMGSVSCSKKKAVSDELPFPDERPPTSIANEPNLAGRDNQSDLAFFGNDSFANVDLKDPGNSVLLGEKESGDDLESTTILETSSLDTSELSTEYPIQLTMIGQDSLNNVATTTTEFHGSLQIDNTQIANGSPVSSSKTLSVKGYTSFQSSHVGLSGEYIVVLIHYPTTGSSYANMLTPSGFKYWNGNLDSLESLKVTDSSGLPTATEDTFFSISLADLTGTIQIYAGYRIGSDSRYSYIFSTATPLYISINQTNSNSVANGKSIIQNEELEVGDADCPYGGTKISTFTDVNLNGSYDATIDENYVTSNICNSVSVILTTTIATGDADCAQGGIQYDTFTDINGNGTYDSDTDINYASNKVCHGIEQNSPVITEGSSVDVTMDEDSSPTAFSLTLNASDSDGNTLTWSVSTSPTSGTASGSGTGASMDFSYTPNSDYNGSDSFIVTVSDGTGRSDTITVNITIDARNDAPNNTEDPTISGTFSSGNTLTAVTGTWDDDTDQTPSTITYTYQWQLADDSDGTNVADISSATSSTYEVLASDSAKYIGVRITATDSGEGSPEAQSVTVFSTYYLID